MCLHCIALRFFALRCVSLLCVSFLCFPFLCFALLCFALLWESVVCDSVFTWTRLDRCQANLIDRSQILAFERLLIHFAFELKLISVNTVWWWCPCVFHMYFLSINTTSVWCPCNFSLRLSWVKEITRTSLERPHQSIPCDRNYPDKNQLRYMFRILCTKLLSWSLNSLFGPF